MKTILILLALLMTGVAQGQVQSKTLVLYFSLPERDGVDASTGASRIVADNKMYGATHYVATQIAQATGGDLVEIKTVSAYPADHKGLVAYAKQEAASHALPKMATTLANLASYDVVFVGYPNWWYDMPRVLYTLFDTYDFGGKTLVPFCTHGGSGFSDSVETIEALEPRARVVALPALSRNNVAQARPEVERWLRERGFMR